MRSIAKTIVDRLKQARSAVLRIQATLAGAQLLLSVWPLAALVAVALWVRRRRTRGEHPDAEHSEEATRAAVNTESEPSETPATNAAVGGAPS